MSKPTFNYATFHTFDPEQSMYGEALRDWDTLERMYFRREEEYEKLFRFLVPAQNREALKNAIYNFVQIARECSFKSGLVTGFDTAKAFGERRALHD